MTAVARCRTFFFFNDTATTEIYTLSLHDALPISTLGNPLKRRFPIGGRRSRRGKKCEKDMIGRSYPSRTFCRSEEHTSELQSHLNLVCRLLLEKKKQRTITYEISQPRKQSDVSKR